LRGRKREDRSLSSIAKIGNRLIFSDARIVNDARIVYVVIPAKATLAFTYVVIPAKAGIHCLLTDANGSPLSRG
jgi:hypothetical protein